MTKTTKQQLANLVKVARLTSANLRDLAISINPKTKEGSACHDLADRLYNATMGLDVDAILK